MNNTAFDYIINGFADVLFLYSDSGDFSLLFNSDVYSVEYVHKFLNQAEQFNNQTVLCD